MNKLHIFEDGTVLENSTDSGNIFRLPKTMGKYYATKVELKGGTVAVCYSFSRYNAGDIVRGFTLRKINDVLSGVIIDGYSSEFDETFICFAEYESFMLCQDYKAVKKLQEVKVSDEDFVKQHLKQNRDVCLIKSNIRSCAVNNIKAKRYKYCRSKILVPFGSRDIEITNCPVDYYLDNNEQIYVYFYLDQKEQLHVLPIAKCFNRLIDENFETVLKLLSDKNFLLAGYTLFESQKGKWKTDEKVRIMITSEAIKGKGQGEQCYARAISMYPENANEIDFDAVYYCELTPPSVGTIFEAYIKSDHSFRKQPRIIENSEFDREKFKVCFCDDALVVKEKEVFSVAPGRFDNYEFESAVKRGDIGSFHYDVLNWIGILGFATDMDILRLILDGIIPEDADSLSQNHRNMCDGIINETYPASAEFYDDQKRTVSYNEYFGYLLPKKVINKLSVLGLINKAMFVTKNSKDKSYRMLFITKMGQDLLAVLEKNKLRHDSLAILRTPQYIKRNLASNQLFHSFMGAFTKWGEFKYDNVLVFPTKVFKLPEREEPEVARVGFSVDITKNDNTVTFMGDAVRNMTGLTKNLDKHNMEDKMPRLINVINNIAKNNNTHTVLTLTFVSYEEIQLWLKDMSDALKMYADSEYFHFYITYDGLTRGDITSGLFEIKDGQLTSVSNVEEEILKLFQ
ncbi:MAG: hypothetical protein J6V58_01835 [Clostridia bacterium]|nr:hypothetical protein [Clostridia bacterium]